MRIGVYPVLKRHDGGVYQYTVAMLRALRDWSLGGFPGLPACEHSFTVLAQSPGAEELADLPAPLWTIVPFRPPWSPLGESATAARPHPDRPRRQDDMRAWMLECGIELMIYPSPHRLSFEAGLEFIMPIHDLQHRLLPQFPEVRADGEWERREYLFRNAARRAAVVLADSQIGREDILRCYARFGACASRVHVLPFLPLCMDETRGRSARFSEAARPFAPQKRYFLYPAQFWSHKNHLRLVEALAALRRNWGIEAELVLTGSTSGAMREEVVSTLRRRAAELEIADRVHVTGYVGDEELTALYRGAVALVMPTFFGPTNIPVLEAWAWDCPVITSNIRGIREQVGDAGLLVDPRHTDSIATGMAQAWTDESLRAGLVARGRARLSRCTRAGYAASLVAAVEAGVQAVRASQAPTMEDVLCPR
ncbi:MAG: glycosyltransferase family 4 protein [Phycisphaerales bacterium]|nr:glycosyltransferase family 4 protein [Phycisphaerales bacterium]